MPELADTLKYELRKRGMSVNALAVKSGIPQPSVRRIVSGETLNPKIETVEKIAKALGMTAGQLFGMCDSFNEGYHALPLVDWDLVPKFKTMAKLDENIFKDNPVYVCPVKVPKFSCCVEVKGPAYEPLFRDKDILFLNCDTIAVDGDVSFLYFKEENKIELRKIVSTPTTILLQKINPDFPGPVYIDTDRADRKNIFFAAVVVGAFRKVST
mgnify:FL=1